MSEAPFPVLVQLDAISASLIDEMYRAERPSLLRRIARRTGLDTAEDMMQQVFVQIGRAHV